MRNKFFASALLISLVIFSPMLHADCVDECVAKAACLKFQSGKKVVCEDPQPKCEEDCKVQADEGDVMFTGTKFTNGNTTIMQGERIAAPLSAFQGGDLKPEDLEPFRKHIVSSTNAHGTVSVSSSSSQRGWILGSGTTENQSTDVHSGVTLSAREEKE